MIGGVGHRRDHDDHVMPGALLDADARRHVADARRGGERGATVFVDDQRHA